MVPGRGPWLLQHLRRLACRLSVEPRWLVLGPPVPLLRLLHRLLRLLDSPRSAPSYALQEVAQASPQVDHALSFRLARFPPSRWLRSIATLPRLPFPLPAAEVLLHCSLHVHQRLDRHDPRR